MSRGGLLKRLSQNKGFLAVAIVGTLGTMAYIPIWYHMNVLPKHNYDHALPRSATIRGAYINSGSRDVGRETEVEVDPYPKAGARRDS
eukprot:gene19295-25942_t